MFALLQARSSKIIWVVLFFGIFTLTYGQSSNLSGITLKTDNEIAASNETLLSLVTSLKNNTTTPFAGTLEIDSDIHLNRVNPGPIKIMLEAGASSFLPIKIWVDKQHAAGNSTVTFRLLDSQKQLIQSTTTVINVSSKRQLRVLSDDAQLMMRQIGDSIRVNTRVYNNGNQIEKIKLTASFPKMQFQNTLLHKEIELKPFSDTIVQFSKIIDQELMSLEYFTVNVAALDQNNDFIGNAITIVQNASGDRRYINPTNNGYSNDFWNDNKITLSTRDLTGNNPSYSIYGKNEIQLNKGKLALSLDGTQWHKTSELPLFTNTWIQYEAHGKGIQLGNLQENDLEINLSGRGVKVYTANDERTKELQLGFMDKSYNLISSSPWSTQGIAGFAKNKFTLSEKTELYSSFIFDRSYGIDSYLLMNNLVWTANSNWKYDFRFGQGLTGASLTEYSLPYKPSIAIGANLQGRTGSYHFSSTNFYSSGYYPGIRKGALLLDERITKNFERSMMWIGVNFYNYNPDFIDPLIYYKNNSENFRAELGINFSLPAQFRLSFIPQVNFENGRYLTLNTSTYQNLSYRSTTINETASWSSKNHQHQVFLSLFQGVAQYPFSTDNKFIHKTQLSWSYQGFQLSAFIQEGNFILAEGLYNSFDSDEKVNRFSVMPSYRKSFWNDRLTIQLNGLYNYDSFSGKSYMLAGMTEWKAFKKTSFFVSLNQYHYQNKSFQTHNTFLQAGITQTLPNSATTTNTKKGTIQIFCFYDRNTNGVYDDGDEPAVDRIVMINQSAFVAQKDGTVKYRAVPYGAYHISVKGKNWMAKEYDLNLVSKTLELSIPLQETGNVRGKFEYIYDAKLQYEVSGVRSGLAVTLTNQQGQIFTFKTNDQGEFIAYLPIGIYQLQIDLSQLPKNVYTEEESRSIIVSKGQSQIIDPLILKVKERKIEIKRFGK